MMRMKMLNYTTIRMLALYCLCIGAFQLKAQQSPDSLNKPAVSITPADTAKKAPVTSSENASKTTKKDSVEIKKRAEKLIASFDTTEVHIEEGDVFSKNVRVVSNIDLPLSFKVDVAFPAEWKSLLNNKKIYTIAPHDTMYVPIRLIPLGKVIGNTKYMINAYLFDTIGAPITSAHINAAKPKIAKWSLTVGPYKRIYFKNDSTEASFTVNVGNEGTEPQDIYMSMGSYRHDIIVTDTAGRIVKNLHSSFTLPQYGDTTLHYKAKLFSAGRNMKRIDSEGYRPGVVNDTKTYSIFVKTTESSLLGSGAKQMYEKLNFVQLPNERKINDYGMYSLPVTMDFNMSNLISLEPVANLYLMGSTNIDNGALISYNAQFIQAFSVLGRSYFVPPFLTVGYFDSKFTVLVGDVGGGGAVGVGGKGINASYKINQRHRIGAFFVVNPGILNRFTYYGAGANYAYTGDIFRTLVTYSHVQNFNTSFALTSDYISSTSSLVLPFNQSISLGVNLGRNYFSGIDRYGLNTNLSYNGIFFKQRLATTASVGYYSPYYTYYNQGDRWTFNHGSSFKLTNKSSLRMTNAYSQYSTVQSYFTASFHSQRVFANTLTYTRSLDVKSSLGTGIFYNIFTDDFYNYTTHSRGVALNYSYTSVANNLLLGASTQLGFSKVVTNPDADNQFFMNLFLLARYRVFSMNFRYTNGNPNIGYFINPSALYYSQQIAASLNYQYQFKNRHFILNNYLSYNLMPQIDRQSFGFTPEINFYSNNGWRFRVTAGYYYTRSQSTQNIYNPYSTLVGTSSGSNEVQDQPIVSQSYTLMFGIRKTFGIPLPFIKRRYPTLSFIAFVDINGNGVCDGDEARLENVVINVNGTEVLTNDRGEAQLKNVPEGEYVWQAFSLDDVHGFFPNIPDKINVIATDSSKSRANREVRPTPIPFVKGVKLVGKVYVDREKLSPEAVNSLLDLAGIRISAVNGHKSTTLTDKDGGFVMYLPYAKYTISMDEKILGTRFRLLENDIEVKLDKGVDNMFVSFYIAENQRKINRKRFDANGNLIEDSSAPVNNGGGGDNAKADSLKNNINSNAGKDLVAEANAAAAKVTPKPLYDVAKDAFLADKIDATTTKGLIYTVQLGAFQKPLNSAVFKGFKNVMYERIDNNFVRITVGNIQTEAEALSEKDNLMKVGFPNAFVSVYHDGKNISLAEAAQIKKNKGK